MSKIILDLCGGTGAWSRPYWVAGYDVWIVTLPNYDVTQFDPPMPVHGILAAPPCTEFAVSGARWWDIKPSWLLDEAIETVKACLHIIKLCDPRWWALENPIGRIAKCVPALGKPAGRFNPCDYGDPWTKKTLLWGRFNMPIKRWVHPTQHSPDHWHSQDLASGRKRGELRSTTPSGFAFAFFLANP